METKIADLKIEATSSEGEIIHSLSSVHKNVSNFMVNIVIDDMKDFFNALNLPADTHVTFSWVADAENFVLDSWNSSW